MVGILEAFMGGASGGVAGIADEELRRRAFEDAEAKRLERQTAVDRERDRLKTEREGILARAMDPLAPENEEATAIRSGMTIPQVRETRGAVRTGVLPEGLDQRTFEQRLRAFSQGMALGAKDPDKYASADARFFETNAARDAYGGVRAPEEAATATIISKGGDLYGGNEASTFSKATGKSQLNPLGQAKAADERAGAAKKAAEVEDIKKGGGGTGSGRQTDFDKKRAAWLELHPGDEQGALDFAAGRRRPTEAEAMKLANDVVKQEQDAGLLRRGDVAARRDALVQRFLSGAAPAPAAAPGAAPSPANSAVVRRGRTKDGRRVELRADGKTYYEGTNQEAR